MRARQVDGLPLRTHLEKLAYDPIAPDAEAREQLENGPEMPTLAFDVWALFEDINRRREYNENGAQRFTWGEISAWCKLMQTRLTAWQLGAVLAIEDGFFVVEAENRKR